MGMVADIMLARVAWSPTYTYILLLFVAAAFVAFVARPRGRGEAQKRLYAGTLIEADGHDKAEVETPTPRLETECIGGGKVRFRRIGVEHLTSSGAVSLAVTFKGKDVEIVERVSAGYGNDRPVQGAEFEIDMTGHEWRHVRWSNEDTGLWCAFTLHVREGIRFEVPLKR